MDYRELSKKTGIPFARVKRYGREFLNPNPLCGMRCGKRRILTGDEPWKLFMAKILLENLRFGIHETRNLLEGIPNKGVWYIRHCNDIVISLDIDALRKRFYN